MMRRAADCGVVSVTVTIVNPALEADTPTGFRTKEPFVGLVGKGAVEAPGLAVSLGARMRAGAQTGDAAPAGQGSYPAVGPPALAQRFFAASSTPKRQLAPPRPPATAHRPPGRATDAVQPVQPTPDKRPARSLRPAPRPAPCATPQPADPLPQTPRPGADTTSQAAIRGPQIAVLEPAPPPPGDRTPRQPHPVGPQPKSPRKAEREKNSARRWAFGSFAGTSRAMVVPVACLG